MYDHILKPHEYDHDMFGVAGGAFTTLSVQETIIFNFSDYFVNTSWRYFHVFNLRKIFKFLAFHFIFSVGSIARIE